MFFKKDFYLKLYFTPNFYITKISTNHPKLLVFQAENKSPRTLYEVFNEDKYKSIMTLYYRLKFSEFPEDHNVSLQLNSSSILGRGNIEIIEKRKLYCLHIQLKKISKSKSTLDKYLNTRILSKTIAYELYSDIQVLPINKSIIISEFLDSYPYSKSIMYRSFKEVIGRSPSVVIRDRKLYWFLKHLAKTNISVSKSYLNFGYSNVTHLHRDFKKTFQTTPIKFRNKHSKF